MVALAGKPSFVRLDAAKVSTTPAQVIEVLEREGGVIIENLISQELAQQIKTDLKPHFDGDTPDKYGFFPETTQRASGLLGISDACVELALGFRVNPGGRQQVLHRDDNDYHPSDKKLPVMIGCVTALTKTTKENGATIAIPRSHLWDPERRPLDEEAIPAELEPGDALIFLGNTYHAGGANITENDYRETVGIFLCQPTLRPAENQFLMIPLERVRQLKPQAQRLLGYGLCEPGVGFMNYSDPMRVLFGVEDEETVNM
ncbi:hypothetical protein N7509_006165 [Penicillium cosmopolitanum]|uniref:Phytanoyl-CoA dioxygenase n=1 Tax=Penicillium cosmopolitanum TaxID=1131564 RepID=A0A9W9W3U4_9EURO|nr:uncharacterized protein N7509_006165 [Penicillium cosmopolitanum]KAJ5398052.1 hypothetical protein N7509_006165 [Penicillium cosmopolitanum]